MVKRGEWWRYRYPYPNDMGRDLAWCLNNDLYLIACYIRYAFEDQRAGKAPLS